MKSTCLELTDFQTNTAQLNAVDFSVIRLPLCKDLDFGRFSAIPMHFSMHIFAPYGIGLQLLEFQSR
jgi:hypothetical protein